MIFGPIKSSPILNVVVIITNDTNDNDDDNFQVVNHQMMTYEKRAIFFQVSMQ